MTSGQEFWNEGKKLKAGRGAARQWPGLRTKDRDSNRMVVHVASVARAARMMSRNSPVRMFSQSPFPRA